MVCSERNEKPSEQARRGIEEQLNTNKFPEGSRLPPERQLAQELLVSRRALREALGQLEAEGRIWRGVGQGTIVGRSPPTRDKQAAIKHLTSPAELLDARLTLEPSIAGLAAIYANTQDLEEIRRCLKKSAGVTEPDGWDRWDSALHHAIGHAAHNVLISALLELLNTARSHTQWGQLRKASLTKDRQHLYSRQHKAILAAIVDRDAAEAEQQMRIHLRTVKQTLLNP